MSVILCQGSLCLSQTLFYVKVVHRLYYIETGRKGGTSFGKGPLVRKSEACTCLRHGNENLLCWEYQRGKTRCTHLFQDSSPAEELREGYDGACWRQVFHRGR